MDHLHVADNTKLIDSIVCEVKSQGVFDQFRRECMADVDTKPAYQNLRQRVESSVSNFLNEQEWKPELNKNQLRERLRRNITETGFLETGVERIVDQVVNPKISTIFLPKIEEIAYKYLGIEKPKPSESKLAAMNAAAAASELANGYIEVKTDFPHTDLEAVSPDSDRSNHNRSSSSENLNISSGSVKLELLNDSIDKMDDFESPAFEPIEGRLSSAMSMKDGHDEDGDNSKLSGISGLTSQDSLESHVKEEVQDETICGETPENNIETVKVEGEPRTNGCNTPTLLITAPSTPPPPPPPPPPMPATHEPVEGTSSDNALNNKVQFINLTDQFNQDSVLSQVSSNSHLSIVTNNSDSNTNHKSPSVDMSEEAQMPKFNESSNSDSNNVANANNNSNSMHQPSAGIKERKPLLTSFDIKQDEIKFEGTDRRQSIGMEIKEEIELLEAMKAIVTLTPPLPPPPPPQQESEATYNVPPPPMECDPHVDKTESSSSSVTTETKNLSLIDIAEPTAEPLPAVQQISETATENEQFKFEAPTTSMDLKGGSSQPATDADSKNRESHKSRRRDRDRSSGDKERHSSSSNNRDKDKKYYSSSRHTSSSSKDRRGKEEAKSTKSADNNKRNDDASKKSESQRTSKHSSSSQHRSSHSTSSSKDHSRDRDKKRDSGDGSKSIRPHHKNESSTQKKRDDSDRSRKSSDGKSPKKGEKSNESNDDDHSAYREKPIDRRRSTDRDSNDGQSNPGSSSSLNRAVDSASVSSTLSAKNSANTSPSMSADASQQANEKNAKTDEAKESYEMPSIHDINHPMFLQPNSTESEEDFVLPTLPIVVDQILTGNEINLELLIGQKNIDPVLTTIQQSLVSSALKKPKVASNFFEAKRLMKVRKQMEREEKKRIEQAIVLVKQYINKNSVMANNYGIADQGVELEFACVNSDDSPAPSISSPIKSISPPITVASVVSAEPVPSELPIDEFYGFTEEDLLSNCFVDHKRKLGELTNSLAYQKNVTYLMEPDDMVASAIKKFARNEVCILEGNSITLITQPQELAAPSQKLESEFDNTFNLVETPFNVTETITIGNEISPAESNRGVQLLFMENIFDLNDQKPAEATKPPNRKRKQTTNKKVATVTSDNNYTTMVKQIKIDATIQMKTCHGHGESSQVSTAIDDNQATSIGQTNTSPTPSDQSVGSKENNFVPKIKKAISRSMAHNMNSNNYVTSIESPAHKDAMMVTSSTIKKSSAAAGQRYSSDDLYKPRPILMGSRSRRRGYDNGEM